VDRTVLPPYAYKESRLQSMQAKAKFLDLQDAMKVASYATSTKDHGITFESGIAIWNDMVIA